MIISITVVVILCISVIEAQYYNTYPYGYSGYYGNNYGYSGALGGYYNPYSYYGSYGSPYGDYSYLYNLYNTYRYTGYPYGSTGLVFGK